MRDYLYQIPIIKVNQILVYIILFRWDYVVLSYSKDSENFKKEYIKVNWR